MFSHLPLINEATAQSAIRACLSRRAAANTDVLMRETRLTRDEIDMNVGRMVANGEVEVLRPVASSRGAVRPGESRIFFRLLREGDDDYLWEQAKPAPAPLSRLPDDYVLLDGHRAIQSTPGSRGGLRRGARKVWKYFFN